MALLVCHTTLILTHTQARARVPVMPHTEKNMKSKCRRDSPTTVFVNTCLNPVPAYPLPPPPTHTDSRRSDQHSSSLPGFYGHSQGSRGDVWGPRQQGINFLLIFVQLFLFLLYAGDFEARGGDQGEAGGPRGRVPDFSLCPLHLLPGRHQQCGG